MDWRQYIHTDPHILVGKPVIRGTRIAVEFILGLFAVGWSAEQVLESYPTLTVEAVQAAFAFASEMLSQESWHTFADKAG